jgi:hypothetical protein
MPIQFQNKKQKHCRYSSKKKNLPLKRGANLKIQKVSNSEKIQKVGVNVEKDCKQKMFCF